jgi:predicted DCC family thiol-disulfide oxidoreductase YuxK
MARVREGYRSGVPERTESALTGKPARSTLALMTRDQRAALLYDADCPFCRWSTRKVLAWDREDRIRPVRLQDPEAAQLLAGMDERARMGSWHLVTAEGKRYSGGTAAPPLFRMLPGGRPLAALASALPRTTDRLYRWVSRHRAFLAKLGARAGPLE